MTGSRKYWRSLVAGAILILATACEQTEVPNPDSVLDTARVERDTAEIKPRSSVVAVSIAYGGCEGPCPLLSYRVDTSLIVSHFAGLHTESPGFFEGVCERRVWEDIVGLSDTLRSIPEGKHADTFDGRLMEVVVVSTTDTTRIFGESRLLPRIVVDHVEKIHGALRKTRFNGASDALSFETRIQYTANDRTKYCK